MHHYALLLDPLQSLEDFTDPQQLASDVRFEAHSGLKSDIAPCPKSAITGLCVL
jgi:hypothetical protein